MTRVKVKIKNNLRAFTFAKNALTPRHQRNFFLKLFDKRPLLPRYFDSERTSLPVKNVKKIQEASFEYKYKNRSLTKNPFDLALYLKLLQQVRPRTIIEIGSFEGGSACWLSDQCTALGLDTQVISLDINPPRNLEDSSTGKVKFLYGDIYNLFASDLTVEISKYARPFLYIEDGPHDYEGCTKALQFFDYFAQSGEYIVIEDGILKDLKYRKYKNGPNRAIIKFVTSNDSYSIDRSYCDFFGYNVTWNTNGYIVKK